MNIILGGVKHCGKTTLGRLLAEQNDSIFVDTDELVEADYFLRVGEKLSCRELYRKLGGDAFRDLEADALLQLSESCGEMDSARVIALGGGVPANPKISLSDLKNLGLFVFLDLPVETAYARILTEGLPPFLAAADDPEKAFRELCDSRRIFYENCADLIFHPDPEATPEENLVRLEELIGDSK